MQVDQIVKLENLSNQKIESFKIEKIGRFYLYLVSDQYGYDKWFRTNKECPLYAERCARPSF